jgi:FixJ family two-component response regulator
MRTAPAKVSIIDDDPSVRKALVRMLTSAHYSLSAFGSADDFLLTLNGNNPECILADYQLPTMTGLDLYAQLHRRGLHIPTIIISANDEIALRKACLKAGVSAFLAKPFSRELLLQSVRSALRPQ